MVAVADLLSDSNLRLSLDIDVYPESPVFRTVLFWIHLAAGLFAGLIILIMSVTGVALTYERQLVRWTTSHLRSTHPSPGALPMDTAVLLREVASRYPSLTVTGLTRRSGPDGAVVVQTSGAPLYVDAYTGTELGSPRGAAMREALATLRTWHRWLATEGEQRALGKAITGWSNVAFLVLVVTGVVLWLPRVLGWAPLRQVLFFKRRYGTAKARDFAWHHVVGIWTAVPLLVIVLGALPMSFPWANDLLYTLAGEEPPRRPAAGPSAESRRPAGNADARTALVQPSFEGLDLALARAAAEQPDWRELSVRFPARDGQPLAVSIDRGNGGQPHLRSTVTVNRTGDVTAREAFADQSVGRQWRSGLRFAHTGELFGLGGQSVAGAASLGATVMVWTGLALAVRRLRAWLSRRTSVSTVTSTSAVAESA